MLFSLAGVSDVASAGFEHSTRMKVRGGHGARQTLEDRPYRAWWALGVLVLVVATRTFGEPRYGAPTQREVCTYGTIRVLVRVQYYAQSPRVHWRETYSY
eukprot:scaffold239627_cov39-Prasinocladus_malaysianus.AAC.1